MSSQDALNAANAKSEAKGREQFIATFNEKYAHYFEFLGGRTSGKGKAKLRCRVCGHEFERYGNFARQDTNLFCPRCHVHRDDVIDVPIDGRLTEHLNELYVSGMSRERVAELTGISARYVRLLVDDDCIAAHDEALQKASDAYSSACRELREAKRAARDSLRESFNELRREIADSKASQILMDAVQHIERDCMCFDETNEFISKYAPVFATCNHCEKDYLFFPDSRRYGRKKAGPYCSRRCMTKHNKSSSNIGHRLRKHGSDDKPRDVIKLDAVIERDDGICYICGCKTSKQDHYFVRGWFTAGDSYPTIDHVIPIAKGGTHTWGNVRLACKRCNSVKRDSTPPRVSKPWSAPEPMEGSLPTAISPTWHFENRPRVSKAW